MNTLEVKFYDFDEVDDRLLEFAVVAARFQSKWIFCKHKQRQTLEIAGGHREAGESIAQTARRELQEETGAIDFELHPICVYSVAREHSQSFGQLFFAEVAQIAQLDKNSEIQSIALLDIQPQNLTYPLIQPYLFRQVQKWLNLISAKDEIWDVLDENRMLTDRTHRRGDPMKKGDFHLVVHIWLQNSKGEFLITRRAANKGFAFMWECTGGSAVAGDDSLAAALREVKEETGLDADPNNGKIVFSYRGSCYFVDVWLFKQDFDIASVVLQEGETIDAKYASQDQILTMIERGEFINFSYLDKLFKETSA